MTFAAAHGKLPNADPVARWYATEPTGHGMLCLWGRTNSSNVMKVLWLLDELGLPCTRLEAGGWFGGTDTPEFRALSPTGLVPALDDGGFTLFESNAILRYLCNQYAPNSRLYPRDARARALVDAWLDMQQTSLGPPQGVVYQAFVRQAPDRRNNATLTLALQQVGAAWAILEQRLQRQPYVTGDVLTLADIAFGPHVHRWLSLPVVRADSHGLRAWYERLRQRPPYMEHCTGPLT